MEIRLKISEPSKLVKIAAKKITSPSTIRMNACSYSRPGADLIRAKKSVIAVILVDLVGALAL